MKKEIGTIEMVTFKTKDHYSQKEALEALSVLNECVSKFDGFIERKLAKSKDDKWVDIVYWTDKKSAMAAAEAVMKDENALKAFEVIDQESMQMSHFNPLVTFSN